MLEYLDALREVGLQSRREFSLKTRGLQHEAHEVPGPQRNQTAPARVESIANANVNAVKGEITIADSENLSRHLRAIAIAEDVTLQSLVGEALNLLLRSRGF